MSRAHWESRHRPDPSDWRMNSKVFLQIFNRWGPPQVDLFSARHIAQLPQYFSFKPDPGAVAVDAFAQDWSNLTPYAFLSCVEWGSTNTSWHINFYHAKKLYTHEV